MESTSVELEITLTVTVHKDAKGKVLFEYGHEYHNTDDILEQIFHLGNALDYVRKNIIEKNKRFVEIPKKYLDIEKGLEEELAMLNHIAAAIYTKQLIDEDNGTGS